MMMSDVAQGGLCVGRLVFLQPCMALLIKPVQDEEDG